jgi:hypothetical protein
LIFKIDQIYYFTTCYLRCQKNLNFDVCSSEKKIAYMLEKICLDLLKLLSMLFLLLRYFNCSIAGLLLKEKIEDPIQPQN